MAPLSRREFIAATMELGGAMALGTKAWSQDGKRRRMADRVALGKTGIEVSYVAMGTGTVGTGTGTNQTRLGQEKFTAIARRALERGITFFDTAEYYRSHPFLRTALEGVPRDKYVLLSKIWFRQSRDVWEALDRYRKELNVDYIDILLFHCVTDGAWPEKLKQMCDDLSAAKEKKIIRAVGISCHGMAPIRAAAESDWVDVILARVNHKGVNAEPPDQLLPLLQKMHDDGKVVLGMKVLGEGRLAGECDECLRFITGLPYVDAITIGFESPDHVDDIAQRLEAISTG